MKKLSFENSRNNITRNLKEENDRAISIVRKSPRFTH